MLPPRLVGPGYYDALGLDRVRSGREALELGDGGHDAADFGQALEAADGGVAGEAALAAVVEQFVAVVGAERQTPIGVAAAVAACLFTEQDADDFDHVSVAGQVVGFHEGTVGLL